ncbi:PREDICTED: lipase member J-like [Nicrophorus vespilloides]|uniref:Lipase member J-like n=1 Tax=Nicrophorus vespilloides TaxID=110193 RepID=A0ABM1MT74_NICVS|nr:PREDICTED: lipase member J-like [Nicrophorus vespilloides]
MKQQLVIAVFLFTFQTVFGHLNNVCTSYSAYGIKLVDPKCSYNSDLFSTTDIIIQNHGYPMEQYTVNSGNRFYLNIFRIPYSPIQPNLANRKPIFLQHGSLSNSDLYVLTGKSSMAMRLSDMGYDVWLGNNRGNFYTSSINGEDKAERSYWNFTLDDMAIYDLPPVFELIANVTKKPGELIYLGHSAATTEGMIYNIRMKDHSKKHIKAFIFVGPVAYINNTPFMKILRILVKLGFNTFGARSRVPTEICSIDGPSWRICVDVFDLFIGPDNNNFPPEQLPFLVSGGDIESLKTLNQLVQIVDSKHFQAYRNKGDLSTTFYNLSDVTIPTYMIVGKDDALATYDNAVRMLEELGSKHKKLYAIEKYNHMNYFYAKNLDVAFNPLLDDALDRIGKL